MVFVVAMTTPIADRDDSLRPQETFEMMFTKRADKTQAQVVGHPSLHRLGSNRDCPGTSTLALARWALSCAVYAKLKALSMVVT